MRPEMDAKAVATIEAARDEVIESTFREQATGPSAPAAEHPLENFKDTLGDVAARMNAEERKPLLAAQQLVARIQPKTAEYESAFKALSDAGFVAPATIRSMEELRQRGALVQRLGIANDALLEYFRNAEPNYRKALEELGVEATMKKGVLTAFRRGNFDLSLKIHEANRRLTETMLELLKLLSREWGSWKTNESGEVIFDRQEAVHEFESLQAQLAKAAAARATAEKELIQRAQKRRSSSR